MTNFNNPKFNAYSGKVAELATTKSRSKGAKAAHKVIKKKKAITEALGRILSAPADPKVAEYILKQFPGLSDTEINGFIELAAMLRLHSRKQYRATIKLIELAGGGNKDTEDTRPINIIVGDQEDKDILEQV